MTLQARETQFEKTFELPAPARRVFAAWVEPAELRNWLCDEAQVEPRVGGLYRFWGRTVPWVTTSEDADGQVEAIDPPHLLVFAYTLRGCPTRVKLRIADKPDNASTITVEHTARGNLWPREDEAKWILGDLWRLAIGNLHSYLRDGAAALRTDFTDASNEIALQIVINAPPEKVFAALTVPELMNQWIATAADVELRRGGRYSFGWTITSNGSDAAATAPAGPFTLVEMTPNRLLVHDWRYADEPLTRVRWELEELPDDKTRVTLKHARYDDKDVNDGYRQGWAAYLVELWKFTDANAQ